ncbi:unnamed protein product [Ranitomeya imitator]|uniref:Aminotransferase class I/classII large domain-containing protein n=1 Tax=Ranitomeya imitator TaxID=111125 RepID=A0ABN9KU82_9NEOB|nr:unnamed protein product [Ranitomeya imitator]
MVLMAKGDVYLRPVGPADITDLLSQGPVYHPLLKKFTHDSLAFERELLSSRVFSSNLVSTLRQSRKLVTTEAYRKGPRKGQKVSKATVARWIRDTITLSYSSCGAAVLEEIRAHSTRAVASSWAERAGASIEQICRAATWSSPSAFFKHYRLDLTSSSDLTFRKRVLEAVVPPNNIHKRLEEKIARFHQREDAILYISCFDANAGLFEAMLTPEDAVLSDELNHASIIDGIRLCKANKYRYRHMDLEDLEAKLKEAQKHRLRLIVTDGVFSMDGDIAPLREICDLAKRYNALVFIDECHATGFMGPNGR